MLRKVGGRMWTVDTAGWGLSEYLKEDDGCRKSNKHT